MKNTKYLIMILIVGIVAHIAIYANKKILNKPAVLDSMVNTTNKPTAETLPINEGRFWINDYNLSFIIPDGYTFEKSDIIDIHGGVYEYDFLKKYTFVDKTEGNTITVDQITSELVFDLDSKFGPYEIYQDKNTNKYITAQYNAKGDTVSVTEAVPIKYIDNNIPVFVSTKRWKTYILPISNNNWLKINITGDGNTEKLDVLINSIKTWY